MSNRLVFSLLCAALIIFMGASVIQGAVDIPLSTLWAVEGSREESLRYILLHIRLPRAVAAVLVGGSLALAGAAMQGLFRNPLVDPSIVGIMSGAALAVSLSIVLLPPALVALLPFDADYVLPLSAFIGGWLSTSLLYALARRNGQLHVAIMLLLGIALAAFTGALTGLLTYLADDQQIRSLTFWSMGSLASFDWVKVAILLTILCFAIPLLLKEARALNAMMLGEHIATHLGFDIKKSKSRLILMVALLSGVCVAFSGGIAFIGLVVPHIMRSIIGANHRLLLPASALCGGLLLLLADLFARVIVAPAELPIGIVTAIIGAPFLAWLVWQKTTKGIT
ncbi:iron ABC transporter permease [Suttonella sp. R2A3]|uniref:FecCD family ABC transporter permease n=1 Tax=Suttonella sp. R2A3 TaxID=2908648 RepID=UPI001F47CE82|nr:iron ABC transporter permease [Suttonella sp. R2A3]UJF25081.1 iron ABC transporter permease [Suttonella sp. R2A3]